MSRQAPPELFYFVSGLWCRTCASTVEAMVERNPNVTSSSLNFASKILRVKLTSLASADLVHQDLSTRAEASGFGFKRLGKGWLQGFQDELKREMERRVRPLMTAVVVFLGMWSSMLAFTGYLGGLTDRQELWLAWFTTAVGAPAVLLGAIPFARAGVRALRSGGTLTLDLFIALGAVTSLCFSLLNLAQAIPFTYVDSAAMVLAVLLLAKNLDARLSYRVSSRILHAVEPLEESVEVLRKGCWSVRPVAQIRKGERLKLAPGQTVPLDGTALGDDVKVDRHLVTGENGVQTLADGSQVLAGLVARSRFEVVVTHPLGKRLIDDWAESTLVTSDREHIHSARLRRWEQRLVHAALGGALLVCFFRFAVTGTLLEGANGFFVGILVFCPCLFASVLPLAKQLASLALLGRGVLLNRAEALFDLPSVKAVYLDKTGTLEGVETFYQPLIHDSSLSTRARDLLSHLKAYSSHPVMKGLSFGRPGRPGELEMFEEVPGQGVTATFSLLGRVTVGRPDFVARATGCRRLPPGNEDFTAVALNRTLVGMLVTQNQFNRSAERFLDQLQALGGENVQISILSGDPDPSAGRRYATRELNYSGNLSPQEKADRIVNPALFVGDGLNDTLALGRAKVSCRLGDRARNFVPVDIHLQGQDPSSLLEVIRYSHKFLKVLKQTALVALSYNVIAITLAATGVFTPPGAVLAMLTSLLLLLASISRLLESSCTTTCSLTG